MSNSMLKNTFAIICAQVVVCALVWAQCPSRCSCPAEHLPCAPGVSIILHDCACCVVCARQHGELCSQTSPCETRKGLRCVYGGGAGAHKRTGVCVGSCFSLMLSYWLITFFTNTLLGSERAFGAGSAERTDEILDMQFIINREDRCLRTRRNTETYFIFKNCTSVQSYKPRFCGLCRDGWCCTPHSTKTVQVEFQCPEGKIIILQQLRNIPPMSHELFSWKVCVKVTSPRPL
ncbi:CCN family member 3-like [Chanodichthys erythropterus]|uniref:CCN family member 3-like n=1 Tax=Chanodichthys erythropterus TaxID=933992 RepID=UPI00351DFF9D